jgi:hypothetical protein
MLRIYKCRIRDLRSPLRPWVLWATALQFASCAEPIPSKGSNYPDRSGKSFYFSTRSFRMIAWYLTAKTRACRSVIHQTDTDRGNRTLPISKELRSLLALLVPSSQRNDTTYLSFEVKDCYRRTECGCCVLCNWDSDLATVTGLAKDFKVRPNLSMY